MNRDATRSDRVRGCLLGGAVGDAMGAPLEFLTLAEIRGRHGAQGPSEMLPAYGRLGAVTDDTQMTMFTVEGLIRAWVRGMLKGTSDVCGIVHHAYLRWLRTQGETSAHPLFDEALDGWLLSVSALHEPRAPGGSCIGGLRRKTLGTVEEPANNSKGCGGLMRIAPVGFWPQDPFVLGRDIAALTHGHPTGYLAAGYMAELVRLLADGQELSRTTLKASRTLSAHRHHEETTRAVTRAIELAREGAPTAEKVESLGAGWIAEEALAISLYCALTARDFEEAVRLAVTHSGDSDSTGCITGAMLGAQHGPDVIPPRWLEPLEFRAELETLAEDYARVLEGADEDEADELAGRYPGW